MDLLALETAINALDSELDSLGTWMWCMTALVALGLLVEYHQDIQEALFKRPRTRKRWPVAAGGILILAGVVGEGIVNFKASKVETALRIDNGKIDVILNQEAGDARTSADKAARDAIRAGDEATTAEQQAKKVGRLATAAHRQAEQLDRQLVSERATRLELEKSLAPRVLALRGLGGGKVNNDPLKTCAGTQAIVEFLPDDAETRRASGYITFVLGSAGWIAPQSKPSAEIEFDSVIVEPSFALIPPGQQLDPRDAVLAAKSEEAADILIDFLKDSGWEAEVGYPLGSPF